MAFSIAVQMLLFGVKANESVTEEEGKGIERKMSDGKIDDEKYSTEECEENDNVTEYLEQDESMKNDEGDVDDEMGTISNEENDKMGTTDNDESMIEETDDSNGDKMER